MTFNVQERLSDGRALLLVVLGLSFAYLAIRGKISPELVSTQFGTLMGFYFGQQSTKALGSNPG